MAEPSAPTFETIRYPSEAKFATVHAAIDNGVVFIRTAAGGAIAVEQATPTSPIYNLNNAACGRNVIIPLGTRDGVPEVVAVTAVNDSADPGILSVMVGVSHLPAVNQEKLTFKATLEKNGGSAFVHLAFHKLD